MRVALKTLVNVNSAVRGWGVVFEYELPLEGGRRPDVVVLTGTAAVVLEFKSSGSVLAGDVDQVRAYARDLAEYHLESRPLTVVPILVLAGANSGWAVDLGDGLVATASDGIARYIERVGGGDRLVDFERWLQSSYEPLPTLVAAAKRIFKNDPLPHVRAALSAGIPEALEYLLDVCGGAERSLSRKMAFITGVPGSGKTLLGLRLVHEGSGVDGRASFLSGNGPLVDVLQYALKSTVFVKDLHKVIHEYGTKGRVPREHIIVFDEAQRAWDRVRVEAKRQLPHSEQDLLVQAGERVDGWCVLVGLVGEGQEIYAGEEAGIEQWADAIDAPNATERWSVHCAPRVADVFDRHEVETADVLDLTVSLRSRRAERLHDWVAHLLAGELAAAARLGSPLYAEGFAMYVTRSLEDAKRYAIERYSGEPDARYGIVATSQDSKLLPQHGVPNDFLSTRKVKYGRWYEAPADDPHSCCAMLDVVTEFGCQGLELDMPIVGWGRDMRWNGTSWDLSPARRRDPIDDPDQLLRNSYRVLLTRGRDGFVVFLPPTDALNLTEHALLAAGVRPLPSEVLLSDAASSSTGS